MSTLVGGTILPTSVVRKDSRIASLHLSSAKSSAMFRLRLRCLVSFATRAYIAFCWDRHVEYLNKCSWVCLDHVCRCEGLAKFQLVQPGSDPFRCFRGRGSRGLLEAPDITLRVFVRARDRSWASFHFSTLMRRFRWARDAGRGMLAVRCRRVAATQRRGGRALLLRVSPIRPRIRSPRCLSGLDTTVSQPDT